MLFLPAGIPLLLSKPVLQHSHNQRHTLPLQHKQEPSSVLFYLKTPNQPTTTTKVVFHYMHQA